MEVDRFQNVNLFDQIYKWELCLLFLLDKSEFLILERKKKQNQEE